MNRFVTLNPNEIIIIFKNEAKILAFQVNIFTFAVVLTMRKYGSGSSKTKNSLFTIGDKTVGKILKK